MAIILYSNGLTEEILPQGLTFSDEEILGFFKAFNNIQTKRLDEVPNTWCVWGELKNPAEDDYNKLASEVIQEHCYSQIFFLHDTEVDPSWNLTDAIIYHNYPIFKKQILKFLDEIAIETIREIEQIREETGKTNMSLEQVAVSTDKRVIFKLDPNKQDSHFFKHDNFQEFAIKCYNFIDTSYKDGVIFPIYADKKMIIVLEESQVKQYLDLLIDFFQKKEEFEKCARLRDIYKNWVAFNEKQKNKPKRGRPKKKKQDDTPTS